MKPTYEQLAQSLERLLAACSGGSGEDKLTSPDRVTWQDSQEMWHATGVPGMFFRRSGENATGHSGGVLTGAGVPILGPRGGRFSGNGTDSTIEILVKALVQAGAARSYSSPTQNESGKYLITVPMDANLDNEELYPRHLNGQEITYERAGRHGAGVLS